MLVRLRLCIIDKNQFSISFTVDILVAGALMIGK